MSAHTIGSWAERAKEMLAAYDSALKSQADHGPDAKMIVMANYGDLCADLLRAAVNDPAVVVGHVDEGLAYRAFIDRNKIPHTRAREIAFSYGWRAANAKERGAAS